MKLNQLSDNPGATKNRKRVGRGTGSGFGKNAGGAVKGFEGGQMPLHRRLPKRGFNNIFRKDYVPLNIGRLQTAIDNGKIDAAAPIDTAVLLASGLVTRARDGIRLLGNGELTAKVDITVVGASKTAIAAVEKAGGQVTVTAKES